MFIRRLLTTVSAALLVAVLVAPASAARSPVNIQLLVKFDVGETFTANGSGVCPRGVSYPTSLYFDPHGDVTTIRAGKTLVCEDGSGSFDILISTGGTNAGAGTSGGWVILGGTGSYERAAGGGEHTGRVRAVENGLVDLLTGAITK